MSKPKGPTFAQVGDDFRAGSSGPNRTEARPYTYTGPHPKANGHTEVDINCPFCNAVVTARTWSLSGGGKRCYCGAIFGDIKGDEPMAYHWNTEPKQESEQP